MRSQHRYTAARPLAFIVVFLLGCVNSGTVAADSPDLTAAEKWVLERVANGEVADFEHPQKRDDKTITAGFLARLLTNTLGGATVKALGVRISGADIAGDVDLSNEEIPYDARLNNCTFKGKVTLIQTHFRKTLTLYETVFQRPADFSSLRIEGNLETDGARFKKGANFGNLRVAGPVLLNGAIFKGETSFYGASIGGDIEANGAQFKKGVSFEVMKVGGSALFHKNAIFDGPARFFGASIAVSLEADGSQFNDTEKGANFESLKVNSNALFRNTVFKGPARFFTATIGNNFETDGASFHGEADFSGLKTVGFGVPNTTFYSSAFLHELRYERIMSGSGDNVMRLIELSKYSPGAYAQLEAYYQREGSQGEADYVHIKGKRRERSNLSLGPWLLNLLVLDGLTGYGRRPWQAAIPCAVFIMLGWLVFRRKEDMEPQKPDYESRHYSAFLYSLDLFLPIIDIQAATVWVPRQNRRIGRLYLPVHVILGWVLVTILVAAITGILK